MSHAITLELSGLHCGACVKRVNDALLPLGRSVDVSLNPPRAVIHNPSATETALIQAVESAGNYQAKPILASQTTLPGPTQSVHPEPKTLVRPEPVEGLTQTWLKTYRPLLIILSLVALAAAIPQLRDHLQSPNATWYFNNHAWMMDFMGGFFVVFAAFKLLDVPAFANAYASYDLLAAKWPRWGLIYPFVELALGLAYLLRLWPTATLWATVIIMGFSALGVIKAVASRQKIQCACLGTVFQLPMSTVTIVEDVGMVLMAGWMLAV
jgi:copper chaperone CopZ